MGKKKENVWFLKKTKQKKKKKKPKKQWLDFFFRASVATINSFAFNHDKSLQI